MDDSTLPRDTPGRKMGSCYSPFMSISELLRTTSHRPWDLPPGRWVMAQRWHDLLFAHWKVPVERLRALVPAALPLDLFEGEAWVGVVPFRMSGIRLRGTPAAPWLSAFPELNVRTYVKVNGKPGVYFFSLDAANPVAVWIARRWFHLPYFHAGMTTLNRGDVIAYKSVRRNAQAPGANFVADYGPTGPVALAQAGTLDHWLTERYCLYTSRPDGGIVRGDIHHVPWPLQPAKADIRSNTMTQGLGLPLTGAPVLHFARRLEVVVWSVVSVGAEAVGGL